MIKVVMVRTSKHYWYQIKTIQNLEALMTIYRDKGDLILRKNWNYKEDPKRIVRFWDGMTLEDAKEISECELALEIYDTWREQRTMSSFLTCEHTFMAAGRSRQIFRILKLFIWG